jgi:transposase-like protein
LLGINRNTINKYFNIFRKNIYNNQLSEKRKLIGEIEVDESYFGPRRVRGKNTKKGRGTHKQPVFGIYERNGRVYTEIIPDCSLRTLRKIIKGKVDLKSTIYSDSWKGYTGLVDIGYDKHLRIKHHKDEFVKGNAHINGIESFWAFTKRRLSKFNGVKKNFHLHLKECEWRWRKTPEDLEKNLSKFLMC